MRSGEFPGPHQAEPVGQQEAFHPLRIRMGPPEHLPERPAVMGIPQVHHLVMGQIPEQFVRQPPGQTVEGEGPPAGAAGPLRLHPADLDTGGLNPKNRLGFLNQMHEEFPPLRLLPIHHGQTSGQNPRLLDLPVTPKNPGPVAAQNLLRTPPRREDHLQNAGPVFQTGIPDVPADHPIGDAKKLTPHTASAAPSARHAGRSSPPE